MWVMINLRNLICWTVLNRVIICQHYLKKQPWFISGIVSLLKFIITSFFCVILNSSMALIWSPTNPICSSFSNFYCAASKFQLPAKFYFDGFEARYVFCVVQWYLTECSICLLATWNVTLVGEGVSLCLLYCALAAKRHHHQWSQ